MKYPIGAQVEFLDGFQSPARYISGTVESYDSRFNTYSVRVSPLVTWTVPEPDIRRIGGGFTPEMKCTCGSHAVGSPHHSKWCDTVSSTPPQLGSVQVTAAEALRRLEERYGGIVATIDRRFYEKEGYRSSFSRFNCGQGTWTL